MTESPMTIGVFARRSRLSTKALRLYDRIGLLAPAEVDGHSGYRYYRADQLATARLISRLRRLDLPLDAIRRIVDTPAEARAAALTEVWSGVESGWAARAILARYLVNRFRLDSGEIVCGEDVLRMDHTVSERDVPEVRVVSELRHVRVPDLSPWIDAACGRLLSSAGRFAAGPLFVIYHGEVTEDSDGPAEVCLTIASDAALEVQGLDRIIPAHTEAFTRITKAEVVYPQILGAFESVERWIRDQDREPAGPPRELYLADFGAAAPGDDVCDVSWPTS